MRPLGLLLLLIGLFGLAVSGLDAVAPTNLPLGDRPGPGPGIAGLILVALAPVVIRVGRARKE